MLSVVLPSRNEQFLPHTIKDLLEKAEGEIEVIAVLDGYWPKESLPEDDRVRIVHKGEAGGMRSAINSGVDVAQGKYIMKCDAHCMFDQGFDVKLAADCEEDWVAIPRRKRLDAELWEPRTDGRADIDYMYLSFPDDNNDRGGAGLHGRKWREKNKDKALKEDKIVDLITSQGSCYFMHKKYYEDLELLDAKSYGNFGSEAQELSFKCWLSGGRMIRNKNTWYAHLHKGNKYGRGWPLGKNEADKATAYTNKWVTNEAWEKQTLPITWMIKKFWPMPEWTEEKYEQLFGEKFEL